MENSNNVTSNEIKMNTTEAKTATNVSDTNIAVNATKSVSFFRNTVEVDNFYRFINENGLRREALVAVKKFCSLAIKKTKKRKRRTTKKNKVIQ